MYFESDDGPMAFEMKFFSRMNWNIIRTKIKKTVSQMTIFKFQT